LFGSNVNSFAFPTHSDVCIYTHTHSSQYRDAGRAKKKLETAVNTACQVSLSAGHFGHACYTFAIPV